MKISKIIGWGILYLFVAYSAICGVLEEYKDFPLVIVFCFVFFIGLGGLLIALLLEPKYKIFKEKRKFRKKKIEFTVKRSKFKSSDEYKYLKNFVMKYKNEYKLSTISKAADADRLILIHLSRNLDSFVRATEIRHMYDDEVALVEKLQNLLEEKDFIFDLDEISWLIEEEVENQNYEDFKQKIMLYKPRLLEDYIQSLLNAYGDNYRDYFNFFQKLLFERKINDSLSESQLAQEIEEFKKELETVQFQKKLEADHLSLISVDELDLMSGEEFENFLNSLFTKMGYRVEQTKLSHDQGADLVMSKFGEKVVVQAKRYSDKVGNKAIQEAVAAIKHYKADRAMVITTSDFSRSAIELAISNRIELVNREKLKEIIRHTL